MPRRQLFPTSMILGGGALLLGSVYEYVAATIGMAGFAILLAGGGGDGGGFGGGDGGGS